MRLPRAEQGWNHVVLGQPEIPPFWPLTHGGFSSRRWGGHEGQEARRMGGRRGGPEASLP